MVGPYLFGSAERENRVRPATVRTNGAAKRSCKWCRLVLRRGRYECSFVRTRARPFVNGILLARCLNLSIRPMVLFEPAETQHEWRSALAQHRLGVKRLPVEDRGSWKNRKEGHETSQLQRPNATYKARSFVRGRDCRYFRPSFFGHLKAEMTMKYVRSLATTCNGSSTRPALNPDIWRHSRRHQGFRRVPAWMALPTPCCSLNTQSRCSGDPCRTVLRDAASIVSPTA
jgi:hypothetical protein